MFSRKQKLGKMLMKAIAIMLTVAMVLPSSLSNVAEAAAKTPKLSITKTANMYVGKKLTISVKNKISGSKYAWDSSNKKVATVDSKGKVTGVKAGNTTITCTVTTSTKVYDLKANVNVVKGADTLSISNKATGKKLVIGDSFKLKTSTKPAKVTDKVTWTTADSSVVKVNKNGKLTAVKPGKAKVTAKTASGKKASVNVKVVDTVTVATQKELTTALAKKDLSKITLKTDASETFTIPAGTYNNTQFVVNAPNADVVNSGVFKNVRVNAIKASTWTERAKGNNFDFRAPQGRLVVSAGSEVNNITLRGAKVDIVVEGSVKGNVTVVANAKTEVNLSGSTTAEVKVVVNGIGAKIVTAIKVIVTLNASAELTFNEGSEGSTVEKTSDAIKEDITNNTDDKSIEDVKVVKEETPTTTTAPTTGEGGVLVPPSGGTDPIKPQPPTEPSIVTVIDESFEGSSTDFIKSGSATIEITDEDAHTGSQSLLVVTGSVNDYDGADYIFENTTGAEVTLTISAFIKLKSGDPLLRLHYARSEGTSLSRYVTIMKIDAVTDDWTEVYGDVVVPVGESINIRFGSQGAPSNEFYLDDVVITRPGNVTIVPVTSVTVTSESAIVNVGSNVTLTAIVEPDNASDKGVIWSSSTPTVATVNATTGEVTGVTAGTAIITATATDGSDKSGSCTVTVPPVMVTSIVFDYTTQSMGIGQERTITATVLPTNATDKEITWTSSDEGVATVVDGVITAVAEGTTVITATANDSGEIEATCNVTVVASIIDVTGVSITVPSKSAINVGETIQLQATVTPADATNKNISWSSSDDMIATVSSNGLVTGVTSGSAIITVTTEDQGETDTITITVNGFGTYVVKTNFDDGNTPTVFAQAGSASLSSDSGIYHGNSGKSLKVTIGGADNYSGVDIVKNSSMSSIVDGNYVFVGAWVYQTKQADLPMRFGSNDNGSNILITGTATQGTWTFIGGIFKKDSSKHNYVRIQSNNITWAANEVFYVDDVVVIDLGTGTTGWDMSNVGLLGFNVFNKNDIVNATFDDETRPNTFSTAGSTLTYSSLIYNGFNGKSLEVTISSDGNWQGVDVVQNSSMGAITDGNYVFVGAWVYQTKQSDLPIRIGSKDDGSNVIAKGTATQNEWTFIGGIFKKDSTKNSYLRVQSDNVNWASNEKFYVDDVVVIDLGN